MKRMHESIGGATQRKACRQALPCAATTTRLASSLVAAAANARAGEPCVTSTFSPGSAVRGKGDLSEESVAAIEFLTQEPMSDRVK